MHKLVYTSIPANIHDNETQKLQFCAIAFKRVLIT